MLEIGPEWGRLRRPRELDAEAETARETENLVARGGDSGRGPAHGEGDRRCRRGGAAEFQKSSFSNKRTLGNFRRAANNDPSETLIN